jgi:retinol dehydrogenase-12
MGFFYTLGSFFGQSWFIPKPTLTEKNLKDQSGKVSHAPPSFCRRTKANIVQVFIVTGGYAGVGWQLTNILYQHNATIYVAGRSTEKGEKAIGEFKKAHPNSKGTLHFLNLDLADLSTIKASADEFMSKEQRLDVLWNNAGVMWPPQGSKSTQGFELQMATNCLGHFLFAELLHPILASTAKSSPPNSVRVCWASSLGMDLNAPEGGAELDNEGAAVAHWKGNQQWNYAFSKAGNYFYGVEFARHHPDSGIVSLSFNPGNLETELQRHTSIPIPGAKYLQKLILYPAVYGGYTELWGGLSEEITATESGLYIAPWGRKHTVRPDIAYGAMRKEQGGSGKSEAFWDWSMKVTKQYM